MDATVRGSSSILVALNSSAILFGREAADHVELRWLGVGECRSEGNTHEYR